LTSLESQKVEGGHQMSGLKMRLLLH
jgi:hypothetical protein